MTEKVRIGFCGVGFMGQQAHLRNYAVLDECEVVAIAELDEVKRVKVAQKYDIKNVYATAKEMLETEKLGGIVASQPFNRHGQVLPELYSSNLPIFTEKPLAASVQIAEKLVTELSNYSSWHMVGYHKRSDPATMAAKAEIERLKKTNELGKMTYIRAVMPAGDWVAKGDRGFIQGPGVDGLIADPPSEDLSSEAYDAYMAFVNYYIHQVNLIRHLLGEDYDVTYADPNGYLMVGTTKSGVTVNLEMTPYSSSIDWQESAKVCFERGFVEINLPAPLAINRPGKVVFFNDIEGGMPHYYEPQMPWDHAFLSQARNFVKAVKGEMKPMCTAEEALKDMVTAREYLRLLKGV